VVIVDDDEDIVASFVNAFSDEFEVIGVTSPEEALARVNRSVAVAVVDERMPRLSGVEVLRHLQAEKPEVIRILLTAYADFDRLAAAVNEAGIFCFLAKPWRDEEMRQTLRQAVEIHHLREENRQLIRRLQQERDTLASQKHFLLSRDARGFAAFIGGSAKLRAVIEQARRVADARISVLIEGERGTGKELLARAIHYEGSRRNQLFAAIDCAAVPDTLAESELFGHRRGAFTDARVDKKGIFEVVDGGTVFLDEIGNMPLSLQARLLRFLQEGEFRPLGDTQTRRVDVRIIAATNRDLRTDIAAGRFRADLYDRVAAFRLTMPPLRERPEDIPTLARHFLARVSAEADKEVKTITDNAIGALSRYHFPGNVRELENEIERAVLLADGPQLELEHFSEMIVAADSVSEDPPGTSSGLRAHLREFERSLIHDALVHTDGNRTRAARALGISYRWLLQRMHDLGLS
jgi:two-component system response regulator HupR/HoxA